MTTPFELDRFLAELDGRRERLLRLVEPGAEVPVEASEEVDDEGSDLYVELRDLGEQLIVADEELRVQQEELEEARRLMASVASERDLLFASSVDAYVLTDERGVVLQTNRAADRLLRPPSARMTPRPIATWFQVSDRATVRTMIGQVRDSTPGSGENADADRMRRAEVAVRRIDGTTVPVTVAVGPATDARGRQLLSWRLTPPTEPVPARLELVERAEPGTESAGSTADLPSSSVLRSGLDRQTVTTVTQFSTRVSRLSRVTDVLDDILDTARSVVPDADFVCVSVLRPGGLWETVASSDAIASACEQLRRDGVAAPDLAGLDDGAADFSRERSLTTPTTTVVADLAADQRWPRFASRATTVGVHSMLSVHLDLPPARGGLLTLYSTAPESFDEHTQFVAAMLGTHVSVALTRVTVENNLRYAIDTRQRIGEAVGVLVARYLITPTIAFDRLVRASQARNIKVRDLAALVVETGLDPAAPDASP